MMRRRLLAGVMATALAAFPLACGDDDDDSGLGGESEDAEGDDASSDETEADDSSDETEADDSSDATEGDDSDEDSGSVTGGDLVRWCEITTDVNENNPFDELDDAADAGEVEAAFDELDSQIDEYVDASPDEVRDDVELTVNAFRSLRSVLEENDWDLTAVASDPEIAEQFNDPALEEAQTNIDEFEDANC